jgi:Na+/H+-translocating membrane pyrophosphatase
LACCFGLLADFFTCFAVYKFSSVFLLRRFIQPSPVLDCLLSLFLLFSYMNLTDTMLSSATLILATINKVMRGTCLWRFSEGEFRSSRIQ